MPPTATSPSTSPLAVVAGVIAAGLNTIGLGSSSRGKASLRLRLMLAWLVFVLLVLNGAALALKILFERSLKHCRDCGAATP